MKSLLVGLVCLLALGVTSCGDEEVTYKTENCTRVTVDGQPYTLCCRLKCVAEYDDDDYRERCTEETTCKTPSGASCPLSVVQAVRFPPCF